MTDVKLNQSPFLSLKARDFLRSFLIAVLTAVVMTIQRLIDENGSIKKSDLALIGGSALSACIAYLVKNFFTKPDAPQN